MEAEAVDEIAASTSLVTTLVVADKLWSKHTLIISILGTVGTQVAQRFEGRGFDGGRIHIHNDNYHYNVPHAPTVTNDS